VKRAKQEAIRREITRVDGHLLVKTFIAKGRKCAIPMDYHNIMLVVPDKLGAIVGKFAEEGAG